MSLDTEVRTWSTDTRSRWPRWLAGAALAVWLCSAVGASAQVFRAPQGTAENLRFEQAAGGMITVTYDLRSDDPNAVFTIVLEVTSASGASITPSSTSGDIGPGVRPGVGKRIVWAASKDVEDLQVSRFTFNIRASAGAGVPVAPGSPAGRPAEPAAAGSTPGASPGGQSTQASSPTPPAGSTFERVWIDLNLGVAVPAEDAYSANFSTLLFSEQARFRADYSFPTGADLDVGAGFLLTERIGVGVNVSGTGHVSPATVSATIPHPRFFNASATGSAETSDDLTKAEGVVHLHGVFILPLSDRLRARVFGGPSYFRVVQDTVDDISYQQIFSTTTGANTVTITGSELIESEATAWGFHVGADFSVFFGRHFGLGAFARFSQATVEQVDLGGIVAERKAGGVQAGIGLRMKF